MLRALNLVNFPAVFNWKCNHLLKQNVMVKLRVGWAPMWCKPWPGGLIKMVPIQWILIADTIT